MALLQTQLPHIRALRDVTPKDLQQYGSLLPDVVLRRARHVLRENARVKQAARALHRGDLATVGDWSQAQPLQCGYPATTPSVGDYLTVDDALPTPVPGQGYYYVTPASYMGQRRYGRKSNGGILTGREPDLLPTCD